MTPRRLARTALLVVTLLSIAASFSTALGQCVDYASSVRWRAGLSTAHYAPGWGTGGTMICLTRVGSTTVVGNDDGEILTLQEVSPGDLEVVGGVSGLNTSYLAAAGDRAYLASAQGLVALQIANDGHATQLFTVPLVDVRHVAVRGDFAYVPRDDRVTVVRVAPSGSVGPVAELIGSAERIAIRSNRGYVISSTGVRVLNIGNPLAPTWIGPAFGPGSLADVAIAGSILYVQEWQGKLRVYSLANPDAPVLTQTLTIQGYRLAVGTARALVGGDEGFTVLDISDPSQPVALGMSRNSPFYQGTTDNLIAYVASGVEGVQEFDLGSGAVPSPLASIVGSADALALGVRGSVLHVLRRQSLTLYNASNPASPLFVSTLPVQFAQAMAVEGDYAYIAEATKLKVVDVSAPAAPVVVGVLEGFAAERLTVEGTRLYGADGINGHFMVVDVANPASPVLLNEHQTSAYVGSIAVRGSRLFVQEGFEFSAWIELYDVTDPGEPMLIETVWLSRWGGPMAVAEDRLLSVNGTRLVSLDANNLGAPWVDLGDFHSAGSIHVSAAGRVYTGTSLGSVSVFDQPSALQYVGSASLPVWSGVTAVEEIGGYLYVASGAGVFVFAPECLAASADGPPIAPSSLLRVAPNPFSAATTITLSMPGTDPAALSIFDVTGRQVRDLGLARPGAVGELKVTWDGRFDQGDRAPAGVYFVRVSRAGRIEVERIQLVH